MAHSRPPRATAALLAAALLTSLLPLAAAIRAQPAAPDAPLAGPGPLDPDLEAEAKGRLIVVHRPDATDAELNAAGVLLRGGPFKADKVSRVAFGAGASAFKASIIDSHDLRRGQPAAAALARDLAPGAAHASEAAAALRARGAVDYAEPDSIVSIAQDTITQTSPPSWGLDRIDQVDRIPSLDNSYIGSYTYPATGGKDVNVYVVDTGVYTAHADFGGRATCPFSVISKLKRLQQCTDGNGHGTHVSGTIGGTQYGVAKKATIIGVQVLNSQGSGTTAGVVKGIDWAVNDCKPATSGKRCVINMSLSGGSSAVLNGSTTAAANAGLIVVVAAGNAAANACSYSPASTQAAITVAASDSSDVMASWSNFGPCADIVAPGVSITSAWNAGANAINTISGTSMASPHVAGAAALLWSVNPRTKNDVEKLIKEGGHDADVVTLCDACTGTTQHLVYVGA